MSMFGGGCRGCDDVMIALVVGNFGGGISVGGGIGVGGSF